MGFSGSIGGLGFWWFNLLFLCVFYAFCLEKESVFLGQGLVGSVWMRPCMGNLRKKKKKGLGFLVHRL